MILSLCPFDATLLLSKAIFMVRIINSHYLRKEQDVEHVHFANILWRMLFNVSCEMIKVLTLNSWPVSLIGSLISKWDSSHSREKHRTLWSAQNHLDVGILGWVTGYLYSISSNTCFGSVWHTLQWWSLITTQQSTALATVSIKRHPCRHSKTNSKPLQRWYEDKTRIPTSRLYFSTNQPSCRNCGQNLPFSTWVMGLDNGQQRDPANIIMSKWSWPLTFCIWNVNTP